MAQAVEQGLQLLRCSDATGKIRASACFAKISRPLPPDSTQRRMVITGQGWCDRTRIGSSSCQTFQTHPFLPADPEAIDALGS